MCANCLSQAEAVAGNLAVTAAVLEAPVHRLLADLGLVVPPDRLARDARTVAFLRGLDLDPVEILGADVVTAADRWTAAGAPAPAGGYATRAAAAASARPIGSQRRIAAA
jgi:hypothetical protein